jgi:S-adenosylmethionine:tRNA ribosyltransferase-isomerase
MKSQLPITEYNYPLTEDYIAKYPLENRDDTRLLVYNAHSIIDSFFRNLNQFIPNHSLFIFNDTKVIKARLIFKKPEGSKIEIFCLNDVSSGVGFAIWKCYVGNSKRWKNQELSLPDKNKSLTLVAKRLSTSEDTHTIKFTWEDPNLSFNEILENFGQIPLPPYLNRVPNECDSTRYQTVYAKNDGSVAAPTAGLHFTQRTFKDLELKKCIWENLTLHVGAGTFKPVMVENALDHTMHEEKIIIQIDTISRLISNISQTIIPVGTTSMRSLESIYWLGNQMYNNGIESLEKTGSFFIDQWCPYKNSNNISALDSLKTIESYMISKNLTELSGYTRIMIVPGYTFKLSKALITNFHQPQSTLLLLVAAFIGENWRDVYIHALENKYRFLSYGDSSLLFPNSQI